MKTGMLSPSMMCVDFAAVKETIETFEAQGVEYLHIDIMDGVFVPNYTLGIDFCEKMRKMSSIPLDIHLMIDRPDTKLDWFKFRPGEYVAIHWESTPHAHRALAAVKACGAKPMLALNPATPVNVLDYVLDDIDGVLVMTVNPGFAGQKMVPSTLQKITDVRSYLDAHGRQDADIEVDGNVSFENAVKMRAAGANIFVGGTSSIFSKNDTMVNNILKSREAVR